MGTAAPTLPSFTLPAVAPGTTSADGPAAPPTCIQALAPPTGPLTPPPIPDWVPASTCALRVTAGSGLVLGGSGLTRGSLALLELATASDLTIVKTASFDGDLVSGDTFSYTIQVTNAGPDAAENVEVTDQVPDGFTIGTVTTSIGSCAAPVNNLVTCTTASLGTGATMTIIIPVTIEDATCGSINNKAKVTATNEPLPQSGVGNSDTVTVRVLCSNVSILKEASESILYPGESFTYTLTVTNEANLFLLDSEIGPPPAFRSPMMCPRS